MIEGFCQINWWLDLIAVIGIFGLNLVGVFSKWLREEFGIPKNIIQVVLAGYLITSIILCNPF